MANLKNGPRRKTARTRRSHLLCSARRSRLAMTLATGLAGGTLLSACQTRVRDAFVGSSKDLFLSLFNPDVFLTALGVPNDDSTTGQ